MVSANDDRGPDQDALDGIPISGSDPRPRLTTGPLQEQGTYW